MSNIDGQFVFRDFFEALHSKVVDVSHDQLKAASNALIECSGRKNQIFFVGNGGSASIASHASVDFTNMAKCTSISFNNSSLLTCLANDFGYENWVQKAVEYYANKGDILVLISSSGNSENIIKGAHTAKEMGLELITFSGFSSKNRLRSLGHFNFWIDSDNYNIVENTHQIWLLAIAEYISRLRKLN